MDFTSLHELLRSTYQEMLPLAGEMTGIAKGVAGWVLSSIWLFEYGPLLLEQSL